MSSISNSSLLPALFTACMVLMNMISTVQATTPSADLKTLNSSTCIPIVLRMTYCLDFLVTGSLVPTPSDQCCLRLKVTTELDFPCIWDFFKKGKGHHKFNLTRAESLPLACGIPFPPILSTSEEVQPAAAAAAAAEALTSESPVPGPSSQVHTADLLEEAPQFSAEKPKLPRLILG